MKIFWSIIKENSDKWYILEVDVEYPRYVHDLHSDFLFLAEGIKFKRFQKVVRNLDSNYVCNNVVHIRTLTQALNHK